MAGFFTNRDISAPSNSPMRLHLSQCGKCGLYKKCISPKMEPTGDGRRRILFVAEAPGEQEDQQGVQLIGDAGQRLRTSLENIGVDLDDCWKTNAVICRPPKNKIETYMVSCCRPNLMKTIRDLRPRVIIVLGSSALQSLLYSEWKKDVGPLSRWVGWTIPSATYNCWLCPTYHPSYILRMGEDPQLVREFERHMASAVNLEREKPRALRLKHLEEQIELIQNPRMAYLRLKDLATKKGTIAFDYEATGLKPEREGHRIVSVSFCLDGEDTFALMYHPKHQSVMKEILQSEKLRKVAANMKFEDRWSRRKIGCRVKRWHWDTMLMSHLLDNRGKISSLKFQAFVQFGIPDYDSHMGAFLHSRYSNSFNKIDQAPTKDLLLYNGLDSLLEYKLMVRQKEILAQNKGE